MTVSRLSGGFSDAVIESQSAFRALMQAMARSGTPQPLGGAVAPPAPLGRELATVALALADHETRIWLSPVLAGSQQVRQWLAFHTGAAIEETPDEAALAFVATPGDMAPLSAFPRGTSEYPDLGATVILGVAGFSGGTQVRLTGPGIATEVCLSPPDLPATWWSERAAMRRAYPLGLDLVFAHGGSIVGLPRSTRVELIEEAAPCMSR